jgi:putative hydrolase of the HAD superfamily
LTAPALLFDLDETLVVEEASVVAALRATARSAPGVDAEALARAVRVRARELWRAGPLHAWCHQIEISASEALWCRFEGDGAEVSALRAWAPSYRREAWRLALAEQNAGDASLAETLAERFMAERRARHETYPDSDAALTELGARHPLALVTNGASCLQREKLAASGLGHHFGAVIVSGEVGRGKPHAAVFALALERLGATSEGAVMVGDSLARDIDGARAAGLRPVWINRAGAPRPPERDGLTEIRSLAELVSRP